MMMDKALRVVLADDHQVVREGLRALLERHGIDVVAEAADGREAVGLALLHQPDVALLDVSMPLLTGVDAGCQILDQRPGAGIVLLTVHLEDHQIAAALRAGIRGYVYKTQAADSLVEAIHEVARGGMCLSPRVCRFVVDAYRDGGDLPADPLTSRERQVLQLVAEGMSTREIAATIAASVKTVESCRGRLMDKLGIHETAGLVRYAIRRGIVQP
jgi:two-component system response regulator NreC